VDSGCDPGPGITAASRCERTLPGTRLPRTSGVALNRMNGRIPPMSKDSVDPYRTTAIEQKLKRLHDGGSPRVIDLFSGCGGLSLAAHRSNCTILGAIEADAAAARSHGLNFHPGSAHHSEARDITTTDPLEFVDSVRERSPSPAESVDLLIGGPPCQAFARVGRAKLREVMVHPEAFLHDQRSGLYKHYIDYVGRLAPVAVVVENVPDVLNYGGMNVFEVMAKGLQNLGYDCSYGLLNSVHFGVPQMRVRCFLVGIASVADVRPTLPSPTHYHASPRGYAGIRSVAVRHMLSLFETNSFTETRAPVRSLPAAVTARDAIGDLPRISEHLEGLFKKAPRRFDSFLPTPPPCDPAPFVQEMRNWPGFESTGEVPDHVIRYLPRDYAIFGRMKPGDQYPEAHEVAVKLFEEHLGGIDNPPTGGSEEYDRIRARFVPPYDPGKFPNKWRKMEADKPARTLMAHLGRDSYSHIHYDDEQQRTISVREAARLQSFPDGFRFTGAMNSAFRQIGNAVPPLLGHAVIANLLRSLRVEPSAKAPEVSRS
jgi:DNA (cytosine-5)-methyltransferase 1